MFNRRAIATFAAVSSFGASALSQPGFLTLSVPAVSLPFLPLPSVSAAPASPSCIPDVPYQILNNIESGKDICSSFLGLTTPVRTVTATETDATTEVLTAPTPFTTNFVIETSTAVVTNTIPGILTFPDKRDVDAAPTLPAHVDALGDDKISSACSCVVTPPAEIDVTATVTTSVYTSTVTTPDAVTVDVTSTVAQTVTTNVIVPPSTPTLSPTFAPQPRYPPLCGNAGLQVGYYSNPFLDTDPQYASFFLDYFKNSVPDQVTVATSAGFSGSCQGSFQFGGRLSPCYNFALNYRGYLYAATDGVYTVSVPLYDEIAMVWVGPAAYAGWTRNNANILVSTGPTGAVGNPGIVRVPLIGGNYYPIRIVYGQNNQNYRFAVTVTTPDGTQVFGQLSSGSAAIVQYSCDGVLGPQFPPFGSEV